MVRPYLNLGRVYMHLGEWQSAQNSIEKAREITEARLGPTHPIMVEILTTSAVILRKTGHRNEARDASRRAKRIAASLPSMLPHNRGSTSRILPRQAVTEPRAV